MSNLPRTSGKEVVAALQRGGFRTSHQRGSHVYLRHPSSPSLVVRRSG
ncbi:MAG: type II toxin-antitoxin system HicA family toxin [Chloroflexi bacterium]|nr:type II toxin-antitoxin system HicA family toxin [Chloroflexota bacterium]